uniref:Uncharacterized protein n=1 Tax=Callorhinchus milii TaxID=7868 RepID=A0A4W3GJE6_CALMI
FPIWIPKVIKKKICSAFLEDTDSHRYGTIRQLWGRGGQPLEHSRAHHGGAHRCLRGPAFRGHAEESQQGERERERARGWGGGKGGKGHR